MTDDASVARVTSETSIVSLESLGLPERYRPLEVIGRGGMGTVIKAEDTELGILVAIKVLNKEVLGDDQKQLQRFSREAQVLAQLNHQYIVQIKSVGFTSANAPFQVMELLQGESLQDRLRRGPLSLSEFKSVFLPLVDGLSYAASAGIVHRDIKPSNIFLHSDSTESERNVKLVDFGIARYDGEGRLQSQTLTDTSVALGSPLYMSPEQCRAEKVDYLSDIYSLGCVMYESLTGLPPFLGDSPLETMYFHCSKEAAPLPAGQPEIDRLSEILLKCLAKDRKLRPQSYSEIAAVVHRALDQMDTEGLERVLDVTNTPKTKRPNAWLLMAIAIPIMAVIALLAYKFTVDPNKHQSEIAEEKTDTQIQILSKGISELRSQQSRAVTAKDKAFSAMRISQLLHELGERYYSMSKFDKAERCFKESMTNTDPKRRWELGERYGWLGQVLQDQNDPTKVREAEEAFTLALRYMINSEPIDDGEEFLRKRARTGMVYARRAALYANTGRMLLARKDIESARDIGAEIERTTLPAGISVVSYNPFIDTKKESYAESQFDLFDKWARPATPQDKLDLACIYLTIGNYLADHTQSAAKLNGPLKTVDKLLHETAGAQLPDWSNVKQVQTQFTEKVKKLRAKQEARSK